MCGIPSTQNRGEIPPSRCSLRAIIAAISNRLSTMDLDPIAGSAPDPECDDLAKSSPGRLPSTFKGRYALVRELGRGGFGTTYLAADTELAGRSVVVKVLFQQHALDAWSLKKFKGEMEALARIDHPGVVSVMDFGQLPGEMPFLVMQYVAGRSLRDVIPRGGLPLA